MPPKRRAASARFAGRKTSETPFTRGASLPDLSEEAVDVDKALRRFVVEGVALVVGGELLGIE